MMVAIIDFEEAGRKKKTILKADAWLD